MAKLKADDITIKDGLAHISLTRGYETVIDIADIPLVCGYSWHVVECKGMMYAARTDRSSGSYKRVRMHRQIMRAKADSLVDHIDGDGLNNTRANLRFASRVENNRNARRNARNTSGVKGVDWVEAKSKWRARIRVDQQRMHLGYYDSIAEAGDAYRLACLKYHGEFARLG